MEKEYVHKLQVFFFFVLSKQFLALLISLWITKKNVDNSPKCIKLVDKFGAVVGKDMHIGFR